MTAVVWGLAVVLRLGLALVNRQANDDHFEVARWILAERRPPHVGECGEKTLFLFPAVLGYAHWLAVGYARTRAWPRPAATLVDASAWGLVALYASSLAALVRHLGWPP